MLPILMVILWASAGILAFQLFAVAAASNYWPFRRWGIEKTATLTVLLLLGPIGLVVIIAGFSYIRSKTKNL